MNYIYIAFDSICSIFYKIIGMKPWKIGYNGYKRLMIRKYIKEEIFNIKCLPEKYGYRLDERIIEYPWFFSKLDNKSGKILDAGSVLNYSYILFQEKLSNKKLFISTLAPERRNYYRKGISYIFEDLRYTCFRDSFFDLIVSLSTIEHIGLDNTVFFKNDVVVKENNPEDYLIAVMEFKRILKTGGKLYLSFPFGENKSCQWYQVFNKDMVNGIISKFEPSNSDISYYKYQLDGWVLSDANSCANATTFDLNSGDEYGEDMAAFSRAICCIELTK